MEAPFARAALQGPGPLGSTEPREVGGTPAAVFASAPAAAARRDWSLSPIVWVARVPVLDANLRVVVSRAGGAR